MSEPTAGPESAEAFHARIMAATDDDGRLPVAVEDMPGWDIFPFELDGLRVKPVLPLADTEPGRMGEDPTTCACTREPDDELLVWSNDRWRLRQLPETGLPVMLTLDPLAHHDLNDLTPELAAELGTLMVAVAVAVEQLPSVGRAHVQKIGDGAAHLHLWFLGRPARSPQFRGSPLLDWEENFPRVPRAVLRANAVAVADRLVETVGGTSGPFARP